MKQHPWNDDEYDKKISMQIEDMKVERKIKWIDKIDREKRESWAGQKSADEQYDGYGEYFD